MTTPFFETILNNAEKLSAEKLREAYNNEDELKEWLKNYHEAQTELTQLIEANKQSIKVAEKNTRSHADIFLDLPECIDYDHPYYGYNWHAINRHLKTLSPRQAVEYLVECEIEVDKWTVPTDINVKNAKEWYSDCILKTTFLKAGNIQRYVEECWNQIHAKQFKKCLDELMEQYKRRAAALPEKTGSNQPAGGEGAEEIASKAYQYLSTGEKDCLINRFAAIGNKEQRVRECERYCQQVNYSNLEKAELCGMGEPTYKRWKARTKMK